MVQPNSRFNARTIERTAVYDSGLRAYMQKVFALMAIGVGVTGLVAFGISNSPAAIQLIFGTPLQWVVIFAPLVFVLAFSFGINRISASTAQILFYAFSALMGLSLSSIFLIYTGTSVARVFFITAGTFAGMALFGYTTKRDLTAMGSFLIMGLWGLVLASIVNIFWQPQGLQFALSILGVLIFTGLTAYDAQQIKNEYHEADDHDVMSKKAIFGALRLYLDFINLFISLMRILGDRR